MKRTAVSSLCVAAAILLTTTVLTHAQGAASAGAPIGAAKAGAGRLVEIQAHDLNAQGKYLFTPATFTAKPGEQLRVRITGMGKMPKVASAHNFVLLKLGADPMAVANASIVAGAAAGYLPANRDAILASTLLAGPGESFEVTFTVPKQPGTYTYICTFPGHLATGMRGTLVVK